MNYIKKMERHQNPSCGYDLLEEISPSFKWVWDLDVASDQLSAQPHNIRLSNEKKTVTKFKKISIANFTQH